MNTNLKSLPKEIGKLKNLEILILDDNNELEVLPESISLLTNLIRIDCDSCKLKKIPNIEKLRKLIFLDFTDNMIGELPDMFGNLELLEMLWLNRNKIKTIPKSLSLLKNLRLIQLANNFITDIPSDFRNSRVNITI